MRDDPQVSKNEQIQSENLPTLPARLPLKGPDVIRNQPNGFSQKVVITEQNFNSPIRDESSANPHFPSIASIKHIKCVVVGDGAVGKTCMLMTYTSQQFPTAYAPTVFDNFSIQVIVNGEQYSFDLFDTAGQEDFQHLRRFTYPNTDVFLICFSVDNKASLENVVKWKDDIVNAVPQAKMILVACKCDKRQTGDKLLITPKEGLNMAKQIGALCYRECSAKSKVGLSEIFNNAASIGAKGNFSPVKQCCNFCTIH